MIKVFVTVGTTRFPSLVDYFDRPSADCEVVIQTADHGFRGTHSECVAFSPAVNKYYAWADVVVTHAGAGTVYSLLEAQQRMIVVPNLDRYDKHQLDLAAFVERNRFAMVVQRLGHYDSVDQMIAACLRFDPQPYTKKPFFMSGFILDLLRSPHEC